MDPTSGEFLYKASDKNISNHIKQLYDTPEKRIKVSESKYVYIRI